MLGACLELVPQNSLALARIKKVDKAGYNKRSGELALAVNATVLGSIFEHVRKWFKNHQCEARDCAFG
jgi:hypothetical protein